MVAVRHSTKKAEIGIIFNNTRERPKSEERTTSLGAGGEKPAPEFLGSSSPRVRAIILAVASGSKNPTHSGGKRKK